MSDPVYPEAPPAVPVSSPPQATPPPSTPPPSSTPTTQPSYPLPTRTEYQISVGEIEDPRTPPAAPPPNLKRDLIVQYRLWMDLTNTAKNNMGLPIYGVIAGYDRSCVTSTTSTANSYFTVIRRQVDQYVADLEAFRERQRNYFFYVLANQEWQAKNSQYQSYLSQVNAHNNAMTGYNDRVRQWNAWVAAGGTGDVNSVVGPRPNPPARVNNPGTPPRAVNHPGEEPTYQGASIAHVTSVKNSWIRRKDLLTNCKNAAAYWGLWNQEINRYITTGVVSEVGDNFIGLSYNGNQNIRKNTAEEFFDFVAKYNLYQENCKNDTAIAAERAKDRHGRNASRKIGEMDRTSKRFSDEINDSLIQFSRLINKISDTISNAESLLAHMTAKSIVGGKG